jgi:hypothetical protein
MRRTHREFDETTLTQLLDALRARAADYPQNPGLIACWPGVPEDRMPAACAELHARGHAIFETTIASTVSRKSRRGWTIAATTEESRPTGTSAPATSARQRAGYEAEGARAGRRPWRAGDS